MTLGVLSLRSGSTRARLPFTEVVPAPAPFAGFGAARVALGGRCIDVVVAADEATRTEGLRGRRSSAPYAGMLFAFPAETDAAFTMAGTPVALDITWFAADGRPVDRARMEPCPAGTDATCPRYGSHRRYRYALERLAPAGGSGGALGSCGSGS